MAYGFGQDENFAGQEVQGTQQNSPWAPLQPYMLEILRRQNEIANQPYQQSPGTVPEMNENLLAMYEQMMGTAQNGNPTMDAANSQLVNTITGGFLNSNPALTSQIRAAQGDLTRSWNNVQRPAWDRAMQNSGSFGNTGVMQANADSENDLMRNLGRIGSDMRFANYNSERGRMMQALGLAPGYASDDRANTLLGLQAGEGLQAYDTANAGQNYRWWQESQNYPQNRLDAFTNTLRSMTPGTGSSVNTSQGVDDWSRILGGALTGAGLFDYFGRPAAPPPPPQYGGGDGN